MFVIMPLTAEHFQRIHRMFALLSRHGTPKALDLDELPLPSPLIGMASGPLPVVLSVPHAGRDYPDWLLGNARAGLSFLEDPRVDELVQPALARGVASVIARAPRAAIDCNRASEELDPRAVAGVEGPCGPRAEAGLGLIASRSPLGGALWRRPIERADLERRLAAAYRPYHQALAARLDDVQLRFDHVVLIDCHSMPPRRRGLAQVVIGDRHGESAEAWAASTAMRVAQQLGFSVAHNAPFAGGYITQRHGDPARGRHAIQVEVDRSLYCRMDGHTPGPGFERVAMLFDRLVNALGQAALDRGMAQAAE